ncbi:Lactococcin A ABC transporter ATP binding and permease protein [Bacillus cytotoxicus]|uniref:hypothetical protein n=1 Tax=Bacillus cytotoxicus TaxID=580165 RepID=UPI0008643094|nr:hypothetical protein [Bacillus cytotoxicus]MDH2892320.1 hypothetical protein [Bacillus cytotoxicus]SCN42444.1 Lactococcin A ABC transporter ATP binding and permease protein [Bacillus cytotoxicus]
MIGIGGIYNLYFQIVATGVSAVKDLLIFVLVGSVAYWLIHFLFGKSKTFRRSGYLQIIAIFFITSFAELIYGLLTGTDLVSILHLILVGLPITVIGLIIWKKYSDTLQFNLEKKKERLQIR